MKNYLRDDLIALKPYNPEQIPYRFKMDANESPWDIPKTIREALAKDLISGTDFNRYPDSDATCLREAIGEHFGVSRDQIIVGAGSDELIQILITAFINKGDSVIYPWPSFSMYRVFTLIGGGRPIEVPLGDEYEYNIDIFSSAIAKYNPKLMFICNPNNPTGNGISMDKLRQLANIFPGVIAIDEAYSDFSQDNMLELIDEFPNIVILRTFSKAMGLAGLRIGYCITSKDLALQINKVKPPYNINSFSQRAAILTLENMDTINYRIGKTIEQREFLSRALKEIHGIRVYPSQANFILIQVARGNELYQELIDKGILVRNFSDHPYLQNCLRITVCDEVANSEFIRAMRDIINEEKVN